MQSHQDEISHETQKNKILCHKRRPSIGKSMPVTALLLKYPITVKGYDKLGTDGLSPEEIEKPPLFFQVDDDLMKNYDPRYYDYKSANENDVASVENIDDDGDNSFEIIDYDKKMNNDDHETSNDQELLECETVTDDDNFNIAGNTKSVACDECVKPSKFVSAEKLITNIINTNHQPTPLKELCNKLCNINCKINSSLSPSKSCTPSTAASSGAAIKYYHDMEDITTVKQELVLDTKTLVTKSLLKVPSKLDLERKKFLDEILRDVNLDKIANIDFENDKQQEQNQHEQQQEQQEQSEINLNNEELLQLDDDKYKNIKIDKNTLHEKFKLAEALAKASMMTSPAAKRRIAARKIEMELDFGRIKPDAGTDFVPPRDLLLYLVRMGSFNAAPKINNTDTQDDHLIIPNGLSCTDLIKHCKALRGESRPQLLRRHWLKSTLTNEQLSEEFNALNLSNSISSEEIGKILKSSSNQIRIFQWNILSQSLGQKNDGFVCCPDEALTWENRKFLIIEEILQNNPDIICLQEVDHFKFLERVLGSQNYCGIFFPKPDSPCLYIEENNGPDGCAIFYKRNKFDLINYDTRILEVWHVQSNQVAIVANFKLKNDSNKEFTVCTTHLKARNGALLSKLRNEQGKDLLKFVNDTSGGNRPILICGDFNAEPIEPVYSTVLNNKELELTSAYAEINEQIEDINDYHIKNINITNVDDNKDNINNQLKCNGSSSIVGDDVIDKSGDNITEENIAEIMAKKEPAYTTWKIRREGEICHTIDYVFYSKNNLRVRNCLLFPESDEIGKDRTPSFRYPSDHFSLACDFEFIETVDTSAASSSSNDHK